MNSLRLAVVMLVSTPGLLSACKSSDSTMGPGRLDRAGQHPAAPQIEPADVQVDSLTMFNGLSGTTMTWDQLVDAAVQADVVIVGETHAHPLGQAAAARLFDELIMRSPDTALSMEFFERDQQVALDDYLNGITDEEEFEKAAHRTPGNYPPGHRDMIESARAAHRPVIAANAPHRYVTLARTDGFERLHGLTPDQERLLAVPESLTTGRYRDDFFEIMKGHDTAMSDADAKTDDPTTEPPPGMHPEDMFRSQNVRDATMADAIARAADAGHRPVFHVVGRFHSDFSGGTVSRLAALRPNLLVWTISVIDDMSDKLRDDDKGRADCVIYVGSNDDENETD